MDTLLNRFMLALCVWREARGESLLGKLYVAQTIKNRMLSPRWPNTIVGVITQPLQFSAFNAGDPNALQFPREGDTVWNDCVACADFVLNTFVPVTTANHYHNKTVLPGWADDAKVVAVEGNHVFYEL